MTARHRFAPEAAGELREAARWHEAQREGLGEAFVDDVFATLERVCVAPEGFAPYTAVPGLRRALVRRFNFALYYRSDAAGVLVVAVVHQRRSAKALATRLRSAPKK